MQQTLGLKFLSRHIRNISRNASSYDSAWPVRRDSLEFATDLSGTGAARTFFSLGFRLQKPALMLSSILNDVFFVGLGPSSDLVTSNASVAFIHQTSEHAHL